MNETIRLWLKQLYEEGIEEAKATIANERLWANGMDDEEVAQVHLGNIVQLEEYIQILSDKIAELEVSRNH